MRVRDGAAALDGMDDVESVNDHGNFQDVRLTGDPQAFLVRLAARTAVYQFELMKPSLHDIFVRIAKPTAEEMRLPAEAAS